MNGRDGAERIRSVGVDWILIAIAVVSPPAGIFFGHWLARKATKEDWDRNSQARQEDRLREDYRRWDSERIDAYSTLWHESLTLTTRLRDLSAYWERDEEAPPEMR